ncbi:MAGE family-domain-containing protein [Syncephalastrum racemosum]|uniref:MAGE family-domain-containing protein n=1 Tax=Syncephalastrum racemosum TaxID=13706 RepID=A0A1X2H0J4_SYNRA|nr:MAGE family-domain-containing protein [Syncephalastrum racemosum]
MSQIRKRARQETQESDEDYGEGPSTQRVRTEDTQSSLTSDASLRQIKDVVRFALACEYKGTFIRRDEISKKVLQQSRGFNPIFAEAQKKLRHLFGMEMVELSAREKPKPGGAVGKTDKPTTSARAYVLRNLLDSHYTLPELIKRSDEEYEKMGVCYVILALIFSKELAMNDTELMGHLDRLRVMSSSEAFGERDELLNSFVKQGYLHRAKLADDAGIEGGPSFEYYWGPRAKAEVSEDQIVDFIASFYDASTPASQLKTYIYKAAGYDIR